MLNWHLLTSKALIIITDRVSRILVGPFFQLQSLELFISGNFTTIDKRRHTPFRRLHLRLEVTWKNFQSKRNTKMTISIKEGMIFGFVWNFETISISFLLPIRQVIFKCHLEKGVYVFYWETLPKCEGVSMF